MARRKANVTTKNQNLTRLRLRRATTQAFDASRAKLRAAVMSSEPGVYSAAQLWDDSWWVEAVDKFVAPVLWDAYMRSAFESLPDGAESVPPWVFRSAERSWRAQVNRVRHLGITVGNRVAVLADMGSGESRGWMLDRLGLVAAAGPLSEGIEDGVVLTEGDAADQGGLSAGAELQQGFKTWVAAGVNTRPSHAEADGQTVGFDEMFDVGGEECEFPGDPALSDAEAINCQCETDYSMDESQIEIPEEWTLYNYLDIEPLDPDKVYTGSEYVDWAGRVGLDIPADVIVEGYDSILAHIHSELNRDAIEAARSFIADQVAARAAAKVVVEQVTGELRSLNEIVDRQLRKPFSFKNFRRTRLRPNETEVLNIGRATSKAGRVQAAIDEGISSIENVHGVPADARPLTFHTSSASAEGSWNAGRINTEMTQFISVSDGTSNLNTVVHEVGHYLDFEDFGTPPGTFGTGTVSFASKAEGGLLSIGNMSPAMQGSMEALYATPEMQAMVAIYEQSNVLGSEIVFNGTTYSGARLNPTFRYMCDPKEVWARAYAQFIAVESGSPAMLAELGTMQGVSGELVTYVWSDASFAPVREAMRETLRLAGVA